MFHLNVIGLLLVAAFALLIPSAFYSALKSETVSVLHDHFTRDRLQDDILRISQLTSVALIAAYGLYLVYSCTSAHSIFDEVIEMDEHRDADRADDMTKPKLTLTETMVSEAGTLSSPQSIPQQGACYCMTSAFGRERRSYALAFTNLLDLHLDCNRSIHCTGHLAAYHSCWEDRRRSQRRST